EKNTRPDPAGSNPDLGAYEKAGVVDPCQLYALFADQQVTIARSKHSASHGDIHTNGLLYFQRGDPNTYTGNLFAVGNIKIDKEITIDGDATAGGKITLDSGSKILGTKTQHASVAAIPLPSLSYSAGGSNVTVGKGKTVAIAPGSYNNVIVNDAGTLKFEAGEYFMNKLETRDDENKLYFDVTDGPIVLNIVNSLKLSEEVTVIITPGGESASTMVTFNTMQSTQVLLGKESYVLGNIIAPNAEVYLAKNVSFRGAICAKKITVDRDVVTLHHSSPGTLPFQKSAPQEEEVVRSEQLTVTSYELAQNYPNPFNPTTMIRFALPEAGEVSLSIYNMSGQLVKQLVAGEFAAGSHNVVWDATDARSVRVASGVYVYVLKAGNFTAQRRLVLLK
ncbi:T9SS type A sorting domain-containing protein, partial [candidate division KSB1 bacterium]|nr:T9SS type A sorting domain-containing protein [candidate division KSB1 bacterium]